MIPVPGAFLIFKITVQMSGFSPKLVGSVLFSFLFFGSSIMSVVSWGGERQSHQNHYFIFKIITSLQGHLKAIFVKGKNPRLT